MTALQPTGSRPHTDRRALLSAFQQAWLSNPRKDLLSGLVVALALIPEAIAFSIIAGVDPKVGLYASFCIAIIISLRRRSAGDDLGRDRGHRHWSSPRWCSEHGVQYLFAATVLAGLIQIGLGAAAASGR